VVALPVAAGAAEQRADGVRNINRVNVSDTTRQRRHVRQAPGLSYGERGYYDPYAAYAYAPYAAYGSAYTPYAAYGFAPGYYAPEAEDVTGGHAAFGFGG
jgi:hypothetical protein